MQLQYVAATNLDVPTFQVTYNLKILTTALFSVILLGRRLYSRQWFALALLAVGVGIVQLQNATPASPDHEGHFEGDKLTGLLAVLIACLTSGLAGVYFELVLKGSKVDLWIRNIQLAFFSLLPALSPVFFPGLTAEGTGFTIWPSLPDEPIFAHFTASAWAVVLVQVLGGLVTAIVVKYSDNIMKGFATSIASKPTQYPSRLGPPANHRPPFGLVVISFMAGVAIFHFQVTTSFVLGSVVVIFATWLYNQPAPTPASATPRLVDPTDSPEFRITSPLLDSHRSSIDSPAGLSIDIAGTNYPPGWDQMRSRQYTGAVPATPDLVVGFDRQMSAAPLPPSR